jgi:hypothetical protein
MRVFRVAVPASRIDRARAFYERVLATAADDTVPSRLCFHCGEVIVAVIDWEVEGGGPFRPAPENLYFATADVDEHTLFLGRGAAWS